MADPKPKPPSSWTESTPTSGATPVASGTPTVKDRTEREKFLIAQSPSVLATLVRQGQTSLEELRPLIGEGKLAEVQNNPVSAAELARTYNVPAAPTPAPVPAAAPGQALFNQPTGGLPNTLQGIAQQARATLTDPLRAPGEPAPASTNVAANGVQSAFRPASSGTAPKSGGGGATSSSGGRSGGGSVSSSQVPAAPPPEVVRGRDGNPYARVNGVLYALPKTFNENDPASMQALAQAMAEGSLNPVTTNSGQDLSFRGGLALPNNGGTYVYGGQQYRNLNQAPVQNPADKLWYNTDGAGNPTGAGFKSESAAKLAQSYTNLGPGLTSRLGNSPAAKASQQGGYSRTFAPGESNFNTFSLDEMIASGATKGRNPADILGTISNNTGQFLDVLYGGIPEGGGMQVVGSPNAPESFTGQLPGNTAIGMSSILGNNGVNTAYWLSQMSGLPPSEVAKLRIDTPEKALQFQQAVETARAQGRMPDFASLYAQNEPKTTEQPMGYPDLKWGGGSTSSNTPFDQAARGFVDYALGSPDLAYLPNATVAPGQSGGQQQNYWWLDDPSLMAKGGQVVTNGPLAMTDMDTGRTVAIAGEAGPERITVDPMKDVKKSSGVTYGDPHKGAGGTWGGPKMMATGGMVYAGSKGWQPTGAPEEESPYDYSNAGLTYAGGSNINVPGASVSGQPVQARLQDMGPKQVEPFLTQNNAMPNQRVGNALTPTSEMYLSGNSYLPVYTESNAKDYSSLGPEMGAVTGYRYVPTIVAGTPAVVKVPEYGNIPRPRSAADQRASQIAYLTQLLSGNGNTDDGFASGRSYGSREAALAALYDLDPKAAMLAAASSGGGGNGGEWGSGNGGGWGGGRGDRNIENEAYRRRQYDIQARNYGRAGLPPPTLLDIPRVEGWEGEGEAPYQRYGREVQNGFALPFDYEVNSPWYNRGNEGMGGGGWGGGQWGGRPGGRPGGGQGGPGGGPRPNQPGGGWGGRPDQESWFNQLPWWARNGRRFGPPVGSGMTGGA